MTRFKKKILNNRFLALALKVGGSRRLVQLQSLPNSSWLKSRTPSCKIISLRKIFQYEELAHLTVSDINRLFSEQKVFCGYQFYFFLCLDTTSESDLLERPIVLFVRCTSHIIRKIRHYLPVKITVKNEKIETETKLVFDDSSLALRSTKPLFDGKKISEVLSEKVNDMDNGTHIIVDIELLDSDAGCGRSEKRNTSKS